MSPSHRRRALLAEPDFVAMPAVWDGLSAKLAAQAGFKTAFMSGSCVVGARLGGPDLDVISFAECMTRSIGSGPRHRTLWCWPMVTMDHTH